VGDHHIKPGSPGDILAHHGIKGMKWGVRKKEELTGLDSSQSPPASGKVTSMSPKAADYHRMASEIEQHAGIDSRQAAEKYGPIKAQNQAAKDRQHREETLKKVGIGLGLGVGAAAIGIAAYKLHQDDGFDEWMRLVDVHLDEKGGARGAAREKLRTLMNAHDSAYENSVDGLHLNWNSGVNLPEGTILRRLSTVAEDTPRPGGFFAAHLDEDVQSYKAILPNFWARWGVGSAESGGFINHYKAREAIRAPSGQDSFDIFKHLIETDDSFNKHFVGFFSPNGARGWDEAVLKQTFVSASQNWVDSGNAYTKHWFSEMQKRGYNAVIDFNDAGRLGRTPLRVFDGTMFDVVKSEPQSLRDFYTAAKNWKPELIHLFLQSGEIVLVHIDDFLRTTKLGRDAIASGMLHLQKKLDRKERR
jgi:hypothetical protein